MNVIMRESVYWLIGLFLIAGNLQAQSQQKENNVQSEISLVWGITHGSFADHVDRPIPGIMISFGGQSPNFPLVLSTEIGWLNYGMDDYVEFRYSGTGNPTVPPVSVINVDMNNSMLMAHLVAGYIPFEGKVSPYVKGLAGFRYLVSGVSIESQAIMDEVRIFVGNDRIYTSSSFDSFAMSFGAEAGVDMEIFNGPVGLHNRVASVSLHLGIRYLFGTEANYLTENSINTALDRIGFEKVESRTNMIIPRLGIRMGF